jgi:hypothetical protein
MHGCGDGRHVYIQTGAEATRWPPCFLNMHVSLLVVLLPSSVCPSPIFSCIVLASRFAIPVQIHLFSLGFVLYTHVVHAWHVTLGMIRRVFMPGRNETRSLVTYGWHRILMDYLLFCKYISEFPPAILGFCKTFF